MATSPMQRRQEILLQERDEARDLLRSLPSLMLKDIPEDEACPICLISFSSIYDEEQGFLKLVKSYGQDMAGTSSSAIETKEDWHGIVRLTVCGHTFCRKDLAEWIECSHGTCPACRDIFFKFTPLAETDYESSDGGEYLPEEDEFDDDDDMEDADADIFPSSDFDPADEFLNDADLEMELHTEEEDDELYEEEWEWHRSQLIRERELYEHYYVRGRHEDVDGDTSHAQSSGSGGLTECSDGPTSEGVLSRTNDNDMNATVADVSLELGTTHDRSTGLDNEHEEEKPHASTF